MKKLTIRNTYTFIFFFYLLFALILISGCSTDDSEGVSDREVFIESITGTWTVDEDSYILINDQNIADLLLGFEISINEDLNYTTNSDQLTLEEFPWGTSGSFVLNDELTVLTREDGLLITLTLSADEQLLDFEFEAEENTGRISGVIGGWKCGFKKK